MWQPTTVHGPMGRLPPLQPASGRPKPSGSATPSPPAPTVHPQTLGLLVGLRLSLSRNSVLVWLEMDGVRRENAAAFAAV